MHGIFNRTNVPKFDMETPTDKAKKIEKMKENNISGWDLISLKKPKNFNLIKSMIQKMRITVFSNAETAITIFLVSKRVGLNNAANIALWETDNRPNPKKN